jgi:uncharacterized protein (TIGR03435 family)
MMGKGVSANTVVSVAYGFSTSARTVDSATLPEGHYDFIASLPSGNNEALQREVKKEWGVIAQYKERQSDVLVLKAKSPNARGMKPVQASPNDSYESWGPGRYKSHNKPLGHLACMLEGAANIPILDRTALTNAFDTDFHWAQTDPESPNLEGMKQALMDQLGLELAPGRESIGMLIVEPAKSPDGPGGRP